MWVRILAATMAYVSLRKTLYCTLFLFTREYKWVPVRVEVDIVEVQWLLSANNNNNNNTGDL